MPDRTRSIGLFLRRRWLLSLIVVLLIATRIALPYILKNSINWFLAHKLESYTGEIVDLDLSLYRGAYELQGLKLMKRGAENNPPFLTVEELDLSLAWRALIHGKILADVTASRPIIRITDSSNEKKKQVKPNTSDLAKTKDKLIPYDVERIRIKNGEAYFRNEDLKIPLLFEIKDLKADVKNIKNMNMSSDKLPSTVEGHALLSSAPVTLKGAFNLLTDKLNAAGVLTVEHFKLPEANPVMLAYGPVTFTSGEFDFYSEMKVTNDSLEGYFKPVLKNVDVVANNEHFLGIKHFAVEMLTAVGNLFLRNEKTKDVVFKFNVSGTLDSPKVDVKGGIDYALGNAFGKPKNEKLEHKVSIHK